MKRKRTYLIIGIALMVAATLASVEFVAQTMFNTRLLRGNIHSFHVSGKVIDAATGRPVGRAHVIIVTWTAQMMSVTRCYGLIADDDGAFSATHMSEYPLNASLQVLAASPDDKYAEFGGSGSLSVRAGTVILEDVLLEVQPHFHEDSSAGTYRYDGFCPSCQQGANIQFLGKGWRVQSR